MDNTFGNNANELFDGNAYKEEYFFDFENDDIESGNKGIKGTINGNFGSNKRSQDKLFKTLNHGGNLEEIIENIDINLEKLSNSLEKKENSGMVARKKLMDKWKKKEITNEEFSIESGKIQKRIDNIYENIRLLEGEKRILETQNLIKQTKKDYKNIFVDEIGIEKHYKSYLEGKNIKKGGSNAFGVYVIPHTEYLLIERSQGSFGYIGNLTYYTSLLDNNPNIPRTLSTFVSEGKMYQVIEKAKGVQLDKINIAMLENIPQKDFDKMVENILIMGEKGLTIDPSKQSNFFYDTKIGISFIDLSAGELNLKFLEKNLVSLFTKGQKNPKIEGKIKQAMENNKII